MYKRQGLCATAEVLGYKVPQDFKVTGFDNLDKAAYFNPVSYTHLDVYKRQGYPAMSIQEIDSEKVIRGSNEGFADSIKINTCLLYTYRCV